MLNQYTGDPRIVREGNLYYIIGMEYGYLWTRAGSRHSWASYSGAYRKLCQIKGV
jgi:hypothetical protein